MERYYTRENANIHRGVHTLSAEATSAYESARETVRRFLGAARTEEIIFTRGTTEAINLVAQSYARPRLGPGDEVLVTELEHHSNIVPWQMVCAQTGARLVVVPIDEHGAVDLARFEALLGPRTCIAAFAHVSNALGTVNPVTEMTRLARAAGAAVMIDGAQASIHEPVDVAALDCDFYAFSGHKALGPTGIGVLFGRSALLDAMPPWQGGGDMIKTVSFSGTEYNDLPYKFEAGTPHIAGAIGLAAALDYFDALDFEAVVAHEHALLAAATARAEAIPACASTGRPRPRRRCCPFTSRVVIRRISARCSITTGWPSAPGITVRCRSCSISGSAGRPVYPSRSTTRWRKSTPYSTPSSRSAPCWWIEAR